MNKIVAMGSSHLGCLDGKNKHALNAKETIPSINEVHSFPGLKLLSARSTNKAAQCKTFMNRIKKVNAETLILCTLSNDCEQLLFKDGKLHKVKETILENWAKTTCLKKLRWKLKDFVLSKESETHIVDGFGNYIMELQETLCYSNFKTVYQMSILERVFANFNGPHVDLLFMVLNSILKGMITKLQVVNRNGVKIEFRFLSMSKQFLEKRMMGNYLSIFRANEADEFFGPRKFNKYDSNNLGNTLVHRSLNCYKTLFQEVEKRVK